MKNLLKALAALLLFFTINCKAQVTVFSDITGRPFNTRNYDGIEGSPYLYDDWMSGAVKMSSGAAYNNVYLKYNEYSGKPYFKGKEDQILEFIDPVAEFTITDKSQRFISSNGKFYELLADGGTKLLKQPLKETQQTMAYVGAPPGKVFVSADKYFTMKDGQLVPLKKDKKGVLTALANKQPEMEAYIKKESPDFKSDADLAKLFTYYNSL